MLRLKDWILLIVLPFVSAWGVDRVTKDWADSLIGAKLYGPVLIGVSRNAGIMLGGLTQWPVLYRVTALSTVGAFLIYIFFMVQYLVPIKSKTFRVGLSVFAGSVLGNVTDRIFLGHVIDFIQVTTPLGATGVFNVSDFLQWFGAGAAFFVLVVKGQVLWPEGEQRGRQWIKPEFQWRYCATYVGVGLAGVLMCGALFYAFLKVTLDETRPMDLMANRTTLKAFGFIFSLVTLIFSATAFLIA
ncbi:MAG: signal peptidase II, partial [Bdellovibrionota bacterium]